MWKYQIFFKYKLEVGSKPNLEKLEARLGLEKIGLVPPLNQGGGDNKPVPFLGGPGGSNISFEKKNIMFYPLGEFYSTRHEDLGAVIQKIGKLRVKRTRYYIIYLSQGNVSISQFRLHCRRTFGLKKLGTFGVPKLVLWLKVLLKDLLIFLSLKCH